MFSTHHFSSSLTKPSAIDDPFGITCHSGSVRCICVCVCVCVCVCAPTSVLCGTMILYSASGLSVARKLCHQFGRRPVLVCESLGRALQHRVWSDSKALSLVFINPSELCQRFLDIFLCLTSLLFKDFQEACEKPSWWATVDEFSDRWR